MKLAITSTGENLTSEVDSNFGRSSHIIIIDSDDMKYEVMENKQAAEVPFGTGINMAGLLINKKVDVLITGNCGPKVFSIMRKAGIKVFSGVEGKVLDVVSKYKSSGNIKAGSSQREDHRD